MIVFRHHRKEELINSKKQLTFEKYLTVIPQNHWISILKFRTINHYLPVETGRWSNILWENRLCLLCNINEIGDEFHYLFICKYLENSRKQFLSSYYYTRPNIYKLNQLLNSKRIGVLKKLAKFINIIINTFKHH